MIVTLQSIATNCEKELDLARVVSTRWFQPRASERNPAPARELMVITDILVRGLKGAERPWVLFILDDDGGATAILEIFQRYQRTTAECAARAA